MADAGVVLSAPGAASLEEIVLDEPAPGEVLVRIEATGVCGTDLHVIREDGWGYDLPVLLGHEGAGIVEAVGDGVEAVRPGERVMLGWKTACGECPACLRGEPRRCGRPPAATGRLHRADGAELTPVLRTGTFATRTVVPAAAVVPLPEGLPAEQACLIGCAVATGVMSVLQTANVWPGARVAVIGCGAVGLAVVQGCRIAGAAEIRALDVDPTKSEQALRFGATHTEPGRVDFAFDVVGRAATFEQAFSLLATGGTIVLVGVPAAGERATIDLPALFGRRARVLVSHGGDHLPQEDFPLLAAWALDGTLDLAGMVTRTAPLEAWDEAFAAMRDGSVIRTVLRP
jgi:S-(hydroxymethyl)mycothiol dehydrogenase